MPKVSLDLPAPDFTLRNFQGEPVSLSDFHGKANVLLVFNRGFT
jgi:peroxiredoxin